MKTISQYILEQFNDLNNIFKTNDKFYEELSKFIFSLNKKPIYLTGTYPYLEKTGETDNNLKSIYQLVDGNKTVDLSDKGLEKIGAKYANNENELYNYLARHSTDTMQLIGLGKFNLSNIVYDNYSNILVINANDYYDSDSNYLYLYFSNSNEGNNVYLVLNNEFGADDDITGHNPNDYLDVNNNGIKEMFNDIKKIINRLK